MINNGINQYGDTFLEGISHNQRKTDERLVKALHKAYQFGEPNDVIRGMTLALRIVRGEQYEKKMLNLRKPVTEKLKDD